MKVQELIDILSEQDPEAEVLLMTQRHYPFENTLYGVTSRAELNGNDEEDEEEDTSPGGDHRPKATDVFLVEGTQLRYGNADAWGCAVR
jgi:hypothetical protein